MSAEREPEPQQKTPAPGQLCVKHTFICSIIEKTRMLADFYIPRLSNDMQIAVQKNHLGGQIFYRNLDTSKKRRHSIIFRRRLVGISPTAT